MTSLFSRATTIKNISLNKLSLGLVALSALLVYYQQEPSLADYVMALAAVVVAIGVLARRHWQILSWVDVPLILYLGYVAIQAAITYQSIDLRFALITLYLGATYFIVKYVLLQNKQQGFRWLFLAYMVVALENKEVIIYNQLTMIA